MSSPCAGIIASASIHRQAVLATSLLDSVDGAGVAVTPEISKAYKRVQNGSDIRGVAIPGTLSVSALHLMVAIVYNGCVVKSAQKCVVYNSTEGVNHGP